MDESTPTRRVRRQDDRTCVWPDCDKPRRRLPDVPSHQTPLCSFHLLQAAAVSRQVDAIETERRLAGLTRRKAEQRAERAANPPAPTPGTVYYLQAGGHIKIGWTSDLAKRMRAYPPGSTLLAVHPGTRADEAAAHRRFAAHRTHGREWYPLAADLMRHIDRVVAEHGAPPAVDFAGKVAEVPRPHSNPGTIRPRAGRRHVS